MDIQILKDRSIENEFLFTASRSSGPGGQNVNKVNTRVEIRFNILKSSVLSESEKEIIYNKLTRRINSEGELSAVSQSERSQLKNREKATEKLLLLLAKALTERPERKSTTPTESSRVERLEKKRRRSRLKSLRNEISDISD